MAQTISIQDRGDGTYLATDTDGQTVVIKGLTAANAAAAKANIKISKVGESTGYNNTSTGNYPSKTVNNQRSTETPTVLMYDSKTKTMVPTDVTSAINFAKDIKNLGIVRKNLLAAGQLTKAESQSDQGTLQRWAEIVYGASADANNNDPFAYAKELQKQGFSHTIAGAGGQGPYTTVSSADEALNAIQSAFDKAYHRLPTEAEIKSWTKKLNAAQIANPSKPNVVNGVTRYEGGIGSPDLWLVNKLMGTKEFQDIQARVNSAAAQSLNAAAADNGVTLTPNQISDFTNRIAHGENIDLIKSSIRDLASLGQPDSVKNLLKQGVDLSTIYSPYKQAMASILEINPATITLNDPTLRSAIGPQGEMSLYDYQNSLRKDPRWQYTNNAKTAVADSVTQVLKDFGFMG